MNKNLIGYRYMLGLNQEQIAKKIGMAASSYSMRETGKREFKQTEMKKIMVIINEKYPKMTMEEIFLRD